MVAGVDIVAVELHGESSAMLRAYRQIPAAADAEHLLGLRTQNDQARVIDIVEQLRGAIVGAVVDHNHIIGEAGLLRES